MLSLHITTLFYSVTTCTFNRCHSRSIDIVFVVLTGRRGGGFGRGGHSKPWERGDPEGHQQEDSDLHGAAPSGDYRNAAPHYQSSLQVGLDNFLSIYIYILKGD